MNYLEFVRLEAEMCQRRAEIQRVLAGGSFWERLRMWWRLRRELKAIDRDLRRP